MINELKKFRKARGVTLKELSEITGISIGYLNDVENLKHNISLEMAYRIAEAFSVSVYDIWRNKDVEASKT